MKQTLKLLTISALTAGLFMLVKAPSVHAADNNLTDGITVDSKLDTGDAAIGDGICDDGNGNCTLRAAMQEANDDPDVSTIRFNLSGASDFTVHGQNGYTFSPATALPDVNTSMVIDGYSQTGASVNTGLIGSPFNGKVLIQIDGANVSGLNLGLHVINSTTTVKGLSIVHTLGAIIVEQGSDGTVIEGNLLGLSPNGAAEGNEQAGIIVMDSDNVTIGGATASARNVISYNDTAGFGGGSSIATQPSGPSSQISNLIIKGNYLGTSLNGKADASEKSKNAAGITLQGVASNSTIGGVQAQEANIIDGTRGGGVILANYSLSALNFVLNPEKVSILGNKIINTSARDLSPGGPNFIGLGIELGELDDSSNPPDGPDSFDFGVNLNDLGDVDTGPNNYINFPVLGSVVQKDDKATVNFSLDAADSPVNQYRVELFANDTANESGYGEGQVFLGAFTVSNGNNQQSVVTLPAGLNIVGRSISATTTAVDSTTQSGFGATSEFAKNVTAADSAASTLAQTGTNVSLLSLIGLGLTLVTGAIMLQRKFSRN